MKCRVKNCDRVSVRPTKCLCEAHYRRLVKYGRPTAGSTHHGDLRKFIDDAISYDGDECLLWPFGTVGNGYGRFWEKHKAKLAHRVVCETVKGRAPTNAHQAAHSCGNGHLGCITPAHLDWKTHAQNQQDKIPHGTSQRGERSATSKLTDVKVIEIRRLLSRKESQQKIADLYGVSQTIISRINLQKAWSHIPQ